jgi:SynChlorMet cassette radical SAM/SPASM protein ScmF
MDYDMTEATICADPVKQKDLKSKASGSMLLDTLIFHVTGSCNLKCRHCWQSADTDESLNDAEERGFISPADLADVLRDAKTLGLNCVKFTGGEPFLHPHILEYLEVADQENLSVIIETNGTLLSEKHVEKLCNIKDLFVAVSLDGVSASIHDGFRGVKGAFDQTIATIQRLTAVDIPVQIIMSLFRENVNTLADVVRLAADLGIGSIKINPVQPMGRGQNLSQHGDTLSVTELLEAAEYCKQKLNPMFDGEIHFSLPMAFKPFSEIQEQKFALCRIFQILGLMPNGDLSFCGIGNIARAMVIGNIYQDNLLDLWEKSPLLVELRERLPKELKGVCSKCILKALCLGECRAQAFDQTNDLMEAFWICREAYAKGVFPESRLVPDNS